jgi:hypothetical protein
MKFTNTHPKVMLHRIANKNWQFEFDLKHNKTKIKDQLKQLAFEFTKEEYVKLVKMPCNYCGIIQEKGFNGIDRVDSTIGYIIDNCVSCCAMCNFMKGCLNKYIFIQRIEHIVTYNKLAQGNLFPNSFKHYNPIYSKYISSANARKLDFKIDKFIFTIITNKPCYLCGKLNTEYHQNGLDRINSSIGYLENNVYSCCGNCNYMKNNYTYKEFIDKCLLIYNKLQIDKIKKIKNISENDVINTELDNHKIVNNDIQEKNIIVKGNKLSTTDRTEYNRIKKQEQRKLLKERYGNDEYNKIRAKEIAEQRKKKE